jgi:hypothetical protein
VSGQPVDKDLTGLRNPSGLTEAGPIELFYKEQDPVHRILRIFPVVLTGGTGRPGNATRFYAMQLYKEAFAYRKMGYAATMVWILFVVVSIVTVVLFATAKYWVYYAAAEER